MLLQLHSRVWFGVNMSNMEKCGEGGSAPNSTKSAAEGVGGGLLEWVECYANKTIADVCFSR